jgi:hypothetical protein
MILALRDSGFPGGKLLSEIFRIFFGVSLDGNKQEKTNEEGLNNREKRELLTYMIDTKSNKKYDINSLFGTRGELLMNAKGIQDYLADLKRILGKNMPEIRGDGHVEEAKLSANIKSYQKWAGIES